MTERTMIAPLHMVQLWLDTRRLIELGRALHLPIRQTDIGYIVHCALGEMFKSMAPHPFSVEGAAGSWTRVLAYTEVPAHELREKAKMAASPLAYSICDWQRLAGKPMPSELPAGLELRFQVRVCPVIRKSKAGSRWSKGQEIDVFLAKVWEVDDPAIPLVREQVYKEWLSGALDRRAAGCRLIQAGIESFSLSKMARRTHAGNRQTRLINRPDAQMGGLLEVSDGAQLTETLRAGIGRHRSFGFGMLKLRLPDDH